MQQKWDKEGMYFMGIIETEAEKLDAPPEEDDRELNDAMNDVAWDDVSGMELDPEKVKEARKAEVCYYRKMGVYEKVPIEDCYRQTGRSPIGVRWVDVNKGGSKAPLYRSRLVANQFNKSKDLELFAATPPLEAFRAVISSSTSGLEEKVLMVNDVSRAYMYAPCKQEMYVELCDEDIETEEDRGKCGKLKMSMYGTRPAARNWQEEFTKTLTKADFKTGKSSPCMLPRAT